MAIYSDKCREFKRGVLSSKECSMYSSCSTFLLLTVCVEAVVVDDAMEDRPHLRLVPLLPFDSSDTTESDRDGEGSTLLSSPSSLRVRVLFMKVRDDAKSERGTTKGQHGGLIWIIADVCLR